MPDQFPIKPTSPSQTIPVEGLNLPSTTHIPEPLVPASPVGFQSVDQNMQINVTPVLPVSSENSPRFLSKKLILIFLLVVILGAVGFFVWKNFIYKPTPQVVTLTYWGFRDKTPGLQSLIAQYESQNPLVKIEYIKQSKEDYRERLANSIAQGKAPDLFEIHNTWLPMFSGQLSSLPAEVMDKNTYANTFYSVAVDDLTKNGDIYGIPVNFDGLGLYINQSIFEASGKTPPNTWDELRKTAHELTILDEDEKIQQAGIAMGRTDNVDHWQDILSLLMLQVGVNPSNPVGKLAEDTLNYFLIFAGEDHDWDESMPPSTKAFAGGKSAMYLGPEYEIDVIKKSNPNLSFKVAKVPQLAKDVPSAPSVNWASYWANSVWIKSKSPLDSWKFINYLSEKSSIEKLNQEDVSSGKIGIISPRIDMADKFSSDPYLGAFYSQALTAKSWYLTSNTYDGSTGINSRISSIYSQAINAILIDNKQPKEILDMIGAELSQILSEYR